MRGKHIEQGGENLQLTPGDGTDGRDIVDKGHQRSNSRIEFEVFDILADFFNGLVERALQFFADAVPFAENILEVPVALDKAAASFNPMGAPRSGLFEIADKHLIQAHGVCAVFADDIVGIDDVPAGFAHLLAVLAEDHAVAGAFGIRLRGGNLPDIIEKFVPETAVKQVERGVLHAAVVPVHGGPVFQGFFACESVLIVGIHITQEIP